MDALRWWTRLDPRKEIGNKVSAIVAHFVWPAAASSFVFDHVVVGYRSKYRRLWRCFLFDFSLQRNI